jgi:molybdopterin synthase sulfur carrier subunit
MSVRVNLHPYLTDGGGEAQVELEGKTVGECIKNLVARFPAMRTKLFGKSDKLHGYIEILVNAQPTFPKELAYPLNDGDEVSILVFLSGG